MTSDDEKKKRRKKESSSKKKKSSKKSPSRSRSRSADSRDGSETSRRDDQRRKASRRSSRTSRRHSSSRSDRYHDRTDTRTSNSLTRAIPPPPLTEEGVSSDDGDIGVSERRNGGYRNGGYEDLQQLKPARPILSFDDGNKRERPPAVLERALESCDWPRVLDFVSNAERDRLEEYFSTECGQHRESPLHVVVSRGPPRLAKHILDLLSSNLATIGMTRDGDGNTPLHLFCANLDKVSKQETVLLKQLAQEAPRALQMPNNEGDTPLHLLVASRACTLGGFAAEAAAEQAVAFVLEECVETAIIQDLSGATPLHIAIAHGAHERVLMRLVDMAPVAAKVSDELGMLPLHYIAAFWQTQFAAVEQLVQAYPEALTKPTKHGDTPLHLLASNCQGKEERVNRQTTKVIELLAGISDFGGENDSAPSPVIVTNAEKMTPLHCCAMFEAPSTLTRIMMKSPVARQAACMTNSFGATPLHIACSQPNMAESIGNVVALGVTEAAEVVDRLRRTPLHVASQNSSCIPKLIQILCDLGHAATMMSTSRGQLPLHLAAQSKPKPKVIEALLRAEPKAAEAKNRSGNTPLHDAAKYQASADVVQLLLDSYADAVYVQNQFGSLPLHMATAYKASPEVVQMLLTSWPDGAAMQNMKQDAPLHYAAVNMTDANVVASLVRAAPAVVLLQNSSGQTPLDRAKANRAPREIIDLLEESEAWERQAGRSDVEESEEDSDEDETDDDS